MALKQDQKYNGTVGHGSALFESQTGTMGYQVILECEDGVADFTIWLTEKNRQRAEKYFKILGVDLSKLQDMTYLEYGLSQEIEGREVCFGTKAEEYQGKSKIKVSWIGKKSDGNLTRSASKFFGGNPKDDEQPIGDSDIPF